VIRPKYLLSLLAACIGFSFIGETASAQYVPGTGTLYNSDDFEDSNITFSFNYPKSSKEEDEQIRHPLGRMSSGKWFESPKRGIPDVVKWVEAPEGGIPGSKGALYLRTRDTGIPGRPSGKQCQDDIILASNPLTINNSPNCTVRVFIPEWDQFERRHGVTFGIRIGMQAPVEKPAKDVGRFFRRSPRMVTEIEPFYPGFFIQFNPKESTGEESDYASVLIRANHMGHEIPGPKITQTGWWTFGMSVTPDGHVHYYASPGADDLTADDFLVSSLPYSMKATHFNTMFFNVVTPDNGQSWSTPWIIDDPKVFRGGSQHRGGSVATQPGAFNR